MRRRNSVDYLERQRHDHILNGFTRYGNCSDCVRNTKIIAEWTAGGRRNLPPKSQRKKIKFLIAQDGRKGDRLSELATHSYQTDVRVETLCFSYDLI